MTHHRALRRPALRGALSLRALPLRVLSLPGLLLAACDPTPSSPPEPPPLSSPLGAPAVEPMSPPPTTPPAASAAAPDAAAPDASPHRTRHLNPDGSPRYTNRLARSASPYLRQHAHNPVDWYPWGEEAFARAKALDLPVFLSVGYSTCHWCHVMEAESFEDEEIAGVLNARFVPVKVDREERPDVDDLYMTAVQMMTGRGGWPMTLILTPDQRPFFGATYLPPRAGARGARQGLLEVLNALADLYATDRAQALDYASDLSDALAAQAAPHDPADLPTAAAIEGAARAYLDRFDARHGGLGGAPKFPQPSIYALLLRAHRRLATQTRTPLLPAVLTTLDAMAAGGIFDHVGGGFHRYATDAQWRIPHFEKMLYDNAQLVTLYLEAYQASGAAHLLRPVERTLAYVAAEMTHPAGGLFSATDADSDGAEGRFFTWTPAQARAVLTPQEAALVEAHYGLRPEGNFDDHTTVLSVALPLADAARAASLSPALNPDDAPALLASAHQKLYAARALRPAPALDDKVITAWNGLMIDAFARAAWVLDSPDALARATSAAAFAHKHLWANGRLHRTWRDGQAQGLGFLDDYAALISGLLSLFEASADPQWLRWAVTLQATLDARFWDTTHGGYFATSDEHDTLLIRAKPDYDGAEPSGNALAALNLLRLAHLKADPTYHARAVTLLKGLSGSLTSNPTQHARLLCALDMALGPSREVFIILPDVPNPAAEAAMLTPLRARFLPNDVRIALREAAAATLAADVPGLAFKTSLGGLPTAYICEHGRCERPITNPSTLLDKL